MLSKPFPRSLLIAAILVATSSLTMSVTAQTEASKQDDSKSNIADENPPSENPKQDLFWVFLSSGKSLEDVASEKVQQMKKSHLENFKRLAEDGKLLAAGSVSDPSESLQGVAVISTDGNERLMQMFQTDELIKGGFQKVQATRMRLEHGVINAGTNGRNGMQEYRMVLIDNSKPNPASTGSEALLDESYQFIESMYGENDVRLALRLSKNEAGRQLILVLDKPEEAAALKARLQKIPAVKGGIWKTKIMPVFFGKGTLNQP